MWSRLYEHPGSRIRWFDGSGNRWSSRNPYTRQSSGCHTSISGVFHKVDHVGNLSAPICATAWTASLPLTGRVCGRGGRAHDESRLPVLDRENYLPFVRKYTRAGQIYLMKNVAMLC